jgi:hypothetical protein
MALPCREVAHRLALEGRLEVKPVRELDIGEVVKRSGVPASTLRYYEQLGLLQALGRRGLRRQYDEQVLERLALIGLGQAAGLSLQQIGLSLPPQRGCAGSRGAAGTGRCAAAADHPAAAGAPAPAARGGLPEAQDAGSAVRSGSCCGTAAHGGFHAWRGSTAPRPR